MARIALYFGLIVKQHLRDVALTNTANIEAWLVAIERQLKTNEHYVKQTNGDVMLAEIGNGHVLDHIRQIRAELSGKETFPERHNLADHPLFRPIKQ